MSISNPSFVPKYISPSELSSYPISNGRLFLVKESKKIVADIDDERVTFTSASDYAEMYSVIIGLDNWTEITNESDSSVSYSYTLNHDSHGFTNNFIPLLMINTGITEDEWTIQYGVLGDTSYTMKISSNYDIIITSNAKFKAKLVLVTIARRVDSIGPTIYVQDLPGISSGSSVTITHNLGIQGVVLGDSTIYPAIIQVYNKSTGSQVIMEVASASANEVVVSATEDIASGQYYIVISG